jgi:ParB/RepB/Spo0J family partition protein
MEENQIAQSGEKQHIPLFMIDANPWQTSEIDQAHAEGLAHDIKENGMMQTPTARPVDGRFQLAFGHHRMAAYKLLSSLGDEQYDNFPLYIHNLSDEQMAIAAFNENEKRRTFNPVDRARAVQKMLESFPWTQEKVAEKLRIDRSGISNMLRMLRLPTFLLNQIAAGEVAVRSAMALLTIYELSGEDQARLNEKFGDTVQDFLASASCGELTSDSIRQVVDQWMKFLHPEPEQLQLVDEPVVIENDTITANEEPADAPMPGQFMPPPPSGIRATQSHIDEWINHPNGEGEDESEPTFEAAAEVPSEEADQRPDNATLSNSEPEVQETQPQSTENHPVQKPVIEELKKDPEDPNAIYLSVAWKTKGVTVSLLKPGWPTPKFRFLNMLKVEMLPGVIREMEQG